jgi:branched-chain amino acid transport system permease protein
MKREWWHVAAWVSMAFLIPLILPSDYQRGLLALAAIYALLGVSINLTFGYLGYVSFGHAAFFGLGAYVAALLSLKIGVNYWLAAGLAMLPAAGLGALIGFASIRIGGVYFAITTLTVAEIFRLLAANWMDLTRGPLGMVVPRPTIGTLDAAGYPFGLYFPTLALLMLGAVLWMVARILRGAYGRAWLAIRESNNLAEAVGISTLRARVENIALSGALAGFAGALLVPHIAIVSPELFSPSYSAMALLIVVLGGIGTLAGPIVGGVLFAWLPELFRDIGDLRFVAFALLLLIMIRIKPEGVIALVPPLERRMWKALGREHTLGKVSAESNKTANTASNALPDHAERPPKGALLLQIDMLSKRFRGVEALTRVSFSAYGGEILGLIGPNGAGKTTCMNVVSGFLPATGGTVRFLNQETAGRAPHHLARRGLVRTFQQTTLYGRLSALDNVLSGTHRLWPASALGAVFRTAGFVKAEARRRVAAEAALEAVGLQHRARVAAEELPYGEQRLLAVALALAVDPVLLLLDEPAAGLNQSEAMHLGGVLAGLRDRGISIILIEHNLRLVMNFCDRIVVLHHGEKIAEGTAADIQRNPAVVAAYLGAPVAS